MSTPLEVWLEKLKDTGFMSSEYETQAIAVIEKLKEALERIEARTYSWVIAQETVNCKHTYGEIREIKKAVLAIDPEKL